MSKGGRLHVHIRELYRRGTVRKSVANTHGHLIVGPSGEPILRLKKELNHAGQELPLYVLYMLPVEAKENKFVTRVGCITLSHLADSINVPCSAATHAHAIRETEEGK